MTVWEMDDKTYNVNIMEYVPDGEFLYKYAERVENGDLKSEAIGFFQNLTVTFKGGSDTDFAQLYADLKEVQEDGTFNHTINFINPAETVNQLMYPDKLQVPIIRLSEDGLSYWGEMTVKFIAVSKL